ncbi:MAG: tRNA (adenosine(37)-N6)-threonylcarbamoyltransferase complex ATPase subunit type 1 TsaE [Gemmatimonadota bacterium]
MAREDPVEPEVFTFERLAPGPADMKLLGQRFGELGPDGAVILLEGPLGAGKTTFAQGVAAGCGVAGPVASPTYNLVLHYNGRRRFVHADLYRLQDPAQLESLDLDEMLSPRGLACVEWPELVAGLVRPPYAMIALAREEHGQRLAGRLVGRAWMGLFEALESGG